MNKFLLLMPFSAMTACNTTKTSDTAETDSSSETVELTCEDVSKTICAAACACDAECAWDADAWIQTASNEEECISMTIQTCEATTNMDFEACNEAVSASSCEEWALGKSLVLEEACYPMSVGYELFSGNGG